MVVTIILAPIHEIKIIAAYIANCIVGELYAKIFSAFENKPKISSDFLLNLSFSCSSKQNDFTTLIPDVFSSTMLFKSSYFLNTFSNNGIASLEITNNTIATKGISAKNINDIFTLIFTAIISENISINGALIAILIII